MSQKRMPWVIPRICRRTHDNADYRGTSSSKYF
ncbi:RNA-directed DNA polymerase [Umezakia ovalisporum]|nr:RNA-directed DNA polymerase [Umezakia ovalisporum]